jgi:predicted  nucleic acid-binding Zn-ribbon protein
LNLTPEQAAKIEVELDDFMKYYQTLQAQIDEVRSQGKRRILTILDESQQVRFNKMLSELQNRPQLR